VDDHLSFTNFVLWLTPTVLMVRGNLTMRGFRPSVSFSGGVV
jgi:hypothetical protein